MHLTDIQALAATHAADRCAANLAMARLNTEMQAVYDRHRHAINAALDRASASEDTLRAAIADHPACFDSPKTHTVDGVKFGLRANAGRLHAPYDDLELADRIRQHLPEREPELVKIVPQVERKVLKGLAPHELEHIGCAIVGGGEQVVITYPKADEAKLAEAAVKQLRGQGANDHVA